MLVDYTNIDPPISLTCVPTPVYPWVVIAILYAICIRFCACKKKKKKNILVGPHEPCFTLKTQTNTISGGYIIQVFTGVSMITLRTLAY